MRIALLHYATAPVIGGVEQVMAAHERLLAEDGHEVIVVSQEGDAAVPLPKQAGAAEYLQALQPHFERCDAVIVHNVMTMPFDPALTEAVAQLATSLAKTRFIAWVHDVAACNPDLAPVPETIARAHECFTYVAVSSHRAEQFAELTGQPCRVIPNGIEPAEVLGLSEPLAGLAARYHLFERDIVLLHPTRLLRRKNVELGLEILREFQTRGIAAALLVTGAADPHNVASSDYADWLRREQVRLEVEDSVIFIADHMAVGRDEMAALYRVADAVFFPSRQEGFGLPLLEAALHRLPVFASDIPPTGELGAAVSLERFALDATAGEISRRIEAVLRQDTATCARRRVLALYSWKRIYTEHFNPLLLAAEHNVRIP